jgi:hypothetical protein
MYAVAVSLGPGCGACTCSELDFCVQSRQDSFKARPKTTRVLRGVGCPSLAFTLYGYW